MLQALSWAALGTGFTFLMTTLGAAVVFFFVEEPRPQFQRTMLGFAAGVMTAASVWSLLLPAIEQSADFGVPGWLPAAAGLLLGVGFLSALDAVLPHLRRAKDMDLTRRQSTLLMAAITLHNVPEGMAVGLAFALAAEGEGMAGAAALALGIGLGIGLYDGLVGPGTGTFAIIAFSSLMKFDLRTANGNGKVLNLASNYASLFTYLMSGLVVFSIGIPCAISGIAGNLLGSHFALRKGAKFIRPMMLVVLVLLLGKLISDAVL